MSRRRTEPLTYDEVLMKYTASAARYLVRRYTYLQLDLDDVIQDLRLWVLGDGRERVERWLANDPQQTTRCYRSLIDHGRQIYEALKAEREGYSVSDVYWYSPVTVTAAMPDVLNPDWTEEGGRIGERTALIVDIRRVLTPDLTAYFTHADVTDPDWNENVSRVINLLGGSLKPHQRRAISNAQAQWITAENNGG